MKESEERTMNGIPIREIWERLQAEFPQEDLCSHPVTKIKYVPAEKIEERLNQVVGMENWDFYTDPPQLCRLGKNGYESCVVSGRLVLYDDAHIPIVRSTCGAADVIYPAESDRPTSVANAFDSAVQDVFKRCAKRFGIARKEKNAAHSNDSRQKENPETLMKVAVLEPFQALPKGGAKTTVSYAGRTVKLVIWSKQWEALQQKYKESFCIGGKLNEISFFGQEKEYHGAVQLEFKRLPDAKQKGKEAV